MSNYLTLEDFRTNAQLGDLAVDGFAQVAIDAAEEAIEAYCERRFYQGGTADVRYYTAENSSWLAVDDISTVVSIETDDNADGTYETSWVASDYLLAPYNASADSRPYTRIEVAPAGTHVFYGTAKGVKITGQFGWPAIPNRIKEATLLQATRFFKRIRSGTFGIEAVTIDGTPIRLQKKLDPDVELMLTRLRKVAVL